MWWELCWGLREVTGHYVPISILTVYFVPPTLGHQVKLESQGGKQFVHVHSVDNTVLLLNLMVA